VPVGKKKGAHSADARRAPLPVQCRHPPTCLAINITCDEMALWPVVYHFQRRPYGGGCLGAESTHVVHSKKNKN
jgi:hypothetical protein